MRLLYSLLTLSAALAVEVFADEGNYHEIAAKFAKRAPTPLYTRNAPRSPPSTLFLNDRSKKFAVDGAALPDVDFNLGENYAGLIPISPNASDENQLFFWFFPSLNPLAEKQVIIWLNGGPGCSSLFGLIQEHGPFLWMPGTFEPIQNPYSWHNLSNIVYIDQPITTGFSRGSKVLNSQEDVAEQFMGFWKNFVEIFSMQGFDIYICGESYAGKYIPFLANAMLDAEDTENFNVKGVHLVNPSINDDALEQAVAVPALHKYNNVLNVNETYLNSVTNKAKECGGTEFFDKWTTEYPPSGKIPSPPNMERSRECNLRNRIIEVVYLVNPCFNVYHLTDFCPYTWNQLQFPSLAGPTDFDDRNYFNRSDVQAQLHIPPTDYYICNGNEDVVFPDGDQSFPSSFEALPTLIERLNNTLIIHGDLDFVLFSKSQVISIQNMTWHGKQGFQEPPSKPQNLYVPYHESLDEIVYSQVYQIAMPDPQYNTAGAGWQGTWHTERGLTFATVPLAGHEVPGYTPGVAYRALEFTLGRIKDLSVMGEYTTYGG